MLLDKSSLGLVALATMAAAETIHVQVGQGEKLTYTPNVIKAEKGDNVVFHFVGGHHDVAQGSHDSPCQSSGEGSIWSGVIDAEETGGKVTFTVPIQDTDPKWLYCSVGKHCQNGMTAVINPPSEGDSLEDYTSNAKTAPKSQAPTAIFGGSLNLAGGDDDDGDDDDDDHHSGSHSHSTTESTSASPTAEGGEVSILPTGTASDIVTDATNSPTATGESPAGSETSAAAASSLLAKDSLVVSAVMGLLALGGAWIGLL
ncbi:hypothetical protein FQN57_007514 [Myotisia sp. PD_48]|nr:hypothetical protein FQN57_007514 [Myotisia sp. PD_48]